jgi:hypothetical protein
MSMETSLFMDHSNSLPTGTVGCLNTLDVCMLKSRNASGHGCSCSLDEWGAGLTCSGPQDSSGPLTSSPTASHDNSL